MPREQLAMDVRSGRELGRDAAYASLAEAYDEARELLEAVAVALDLEDEERVAEAVEGVRAWWRKQ